jgi:hypothetical protein
VPQNACYQAETAERPAPRGSARISGSSTIRRPSTQGLGRFPIAENYRLGKPMCRFPQREDRAAKPYFSYPVACVISFSAPGGDAWAGWRQPLRG